MDKVRLRLKFVYRPQQALLLLHVACSPLLLFVAGVVLMKKHSIEACLFHGVCYNLICVRSCTEEGGIKRSFG